MAGTTNKHAFVKSSQKEDLASPETHPPERAPKDREEADKKEKEAADNAAFIIVAALTLVCGLAALITWLALRPVHAPKYYIDDVQIGSFAMSNSTASTLNASVAFTVTATNENKKMEFKYDWITIDASYSGQNFGRASIAGFKQGKSSNTTTTTEFNVRDITLPEKTTASLTAAIQNGTVALRAYAKAKIHVKIAKYVSFAVNVDVDCRLAVVPPSPTAAAKVVSKVCKLTRPPYKKAKAFKTFKPLH